MPCFVTCSQQHHHSKAAASALPFPSLAMPACSTRCTCSRMFTAAGRHPCSTVLTECLSGHACLQYTVYCLRGCIYPGSMPNPTLQGSSTCVEDTTVRCVRQTTCSNIMYSRFLCQTGTCNRAAAMRLWAAMYCLPCRPHPLAGTTTRPWWCPGWQACRLIRAHARAWPSACQVEARVEGRAVGWSGQVGAR